MDPEFSVVIPAYNAAATIAACLIALGSTRVPAGGFETIVVDDGSTDATPAIVRTFPVRLLRQRNRGASAARNAGMRAARGRWVAFIDSDCVPARGWLTALAGAVATADRPPLGAAGATIGIPAAAPAPRFVNLTGGLDAARHLAHPRWPFPPSANVLYRRDALLAVGGFDERFHTYEACDLHDRLRRHDDAAFTFVPHAVVMHQHRATWSAYWRQQVGYGVGYAQFLRSRAAEIPWSLFHEGREWGRLFALALAAAVPQRDPDRALVRRGTFVKHAAQRVGFVRTYWRRSERRRWRTQRALA
jgi:glycosyltransferase involved in cell wall biosynthesis